LGQSDLLDTMDTLYQANAILRHKIDISIGNQYSIKKLFKGVKL
jgi:hypothetical protein